MVVLVVVGLLLWLVNNYIPMEARIKQILNTVVVASPTLANMTLDGVEALLEKRFGAKSSQKRKQNKINFIRYADDYVITGVTEAI